MKVLKAFVICVVALIYVFPTLIVSILAFISLFVTNNKKYLRDTKFAKIYFFPINWMEKNWYKDKKKDERENTF